MPDGAKRKGGAFGMSENTEIKTITTAEALGKYRKELIEQGFGLDEVESLVRNASNALLRTGLVVKA